MGSLIAAINFLSIIPIGRKTGRASADLKGAVKFFPLVGLLFGALLLLLKMVLNSSMPQMVISALQVLLLTILSGAIHLDGLADTMDGFLGGGEKRKILEIMEDSAIGVFGGAAISLSLLLKFTAITSLKGSVMIEALLLFPFLSRTALVFCMVLFPCARAQGKASSMAASGDYKNLLTVCFFLLCLVYIFPNSLSAALLSISLCLLVAGLISKKIGGLTGDTYGALVETAEISVLIAYVFRSGL